MFNHHMPMVFRDYILVKKSTVFLAAAALAGLVGAHYYKSHRKEMNELADKAKDVVQKGKDKVEDLAEDMQGK